MKKAFLLFTLYILVIHCSPKGDASLNNSTVIIADSTLAAKIVATEDDYTKNLGTYDLSLAADSGADVTLQDFFKHLQKNVRGWTEEERGKLISFVKKAEPRLDSLKLKLPDEIIIIKTTSNEYGGIRAGYTRQNAIFFTESLLKSNDVRLYDVFLHEIFHIYSRANPEKKEALYNIIDFYQGSDVSLPEDWFNRRISNPDAPALNVYIDLTVVGTKATFMPIFYALQIPYNPSKPGGIFQSANFGLMKVEEHGGLYVPVFEKGFPVIMNPAGIEDYWKKIGRNSNYIIHPEEIMASNFVHLVNQTKGLPDPKIIDAMYKIITE